MANNIALDMYVVSYELDCFFVFFFYARDHALILRCLYRSVMICFTCLCTKQAFIHAVDFGAALLASKLLSCVSFFFLHNFNVTFFYVKRAC